jgi:hypothetical protein
MHTLILIWMILRYTNMHLKLSLISSVPPLTKIRPSWMNSRVKIHSVASSNTFSMRSSSHLCTHKHTNTHSLIHSFAVCTFTHSFFLSSGRKLYWWLFRDRNPLLFMDWQWLSNCYVAMQSPLTILSLNSQIWVLSFKSLSNIFHLSSNSSYRYSFTLNHSLKLTHSLTHSLTQYSVIFILFTRLICFVRKSNSSKMKTTIGEIEPFGSHRLRILEFFLALVQTNYRCIDEVLINLDTFTHCLVCYFHIQFIHSLPLTHTHTHTHTHTKHTKHTHIH